MNIPFSYWVCAFFGACLMGFIAWNWGWIVVFWAWIGMMATLIFTVILGQIIANRRK